MKDTDDWRDEVLAVELGKLGGFGAAWVSKRLPAEEFAATCNLNQSVDSVVALIEQLLGSPMEVDDKGRRFVSFVVGSGYLDLNPTVVSVMASELETGQCQLEVQSRAKEGIIKQQTARKAALKVIAKLQEHLPPPK